MDGAIHRVGGPRILEECQAYVSAHGRLPTGQALVTSGGNLPAKYVIHTVGPIYRKEKDKEKEKEQENELRCCYLESLKLAVKHGIKTIAFPSISTGAYRYPLEEAAVVAVGAVGDFLFKDTSVKEIYFVLFNDETYAAYLAAAQDLLSERNRNAPRCSQGIEAGKVGGVEGPG